MKLLTSGAGDCIASLYLVVGSEVARLSLEGSFDWGEMPEYCSWNLHVAVTHPITVGNRRLRSSQSQFESDFIRGDELNGFLWDHKSIV